MDVVGHAGIISATRPEAVRRRNLTGAAGSTNVLGYLPAGWRWRSSWNVIGDRIDDRNSFPIVRSIEEVSETAGADTLRDAARIGNPFVSASLADYRVRMKFLEPVSSAIPGPMSSLYSGVGRSGRGSDFPYPGPRRVV